jgi:16S rRNA (guanine527-N7)-methyltransferase
MKWNRSISLTTVTNPDEILQFHFGESIFAASVVVFQNSRLADFGAGAGFPGLPVRMIAPSIELSLVESNLKRCAFLAEVTRELGLAEVTILKSRVESLGPESGLFEFVTARAFGQFELLLDRAGRMLTKGGRVILWLGEKDTESLARRTDWEWISPVRIPNSERRFILVGSPRC